MGKSKQDRFGKGSYLENVEKKDQKSEFILGHDELGDNRGGTKSAAFAPSNLDKSEWLKQNTALADKDMESCEGYNNFSTTKSEFDMDPCSSQNAVFKNRSERFVDPKLDEGANSLGAVVQSDFEKAPKCGTSYQKNRRHGRFSEFGGIHNHVAKPTQNKSGNMFAARILENVQEENSSDEEGQIHPCDEEGEINP